MLTKGEATTLVKQSLDAQAAESSCDLAILEDATIDCEFGWVFFYNSLDYVKSGNSRDMLAGNAPLIVDKESGKLSVTGTAEPVEHYIENYRQHGSPHMSS